MEEKDWTTSGLAKSYIEMYHCYSTHHYDPWPVVIEKAREALLFDIDGRCFIDMLSGYSVANFGHCHPGLISSLSCQAHRLDAISNMAVTPVCAELCRELADFSKLPEAKAMIMNSGAEAVEKAIKIARKWGYERKGIPTDKAEVIVSRSNFHGRTLGVLSASTNEDYKKGFGPFLPGFRWFSFDALGNLKYVINENTVALLVEPIQGEGGFIFPPQGYFKEVAKICQKNNVLLILDEIPTAFGRTGYNLPHEYDQIVPDMIILGKALGGGLVPISAVVGRGEVMEVIQPGQDGSTFGGYPIACAVGLAVMNLIREGSWSRGSQLKGRYFLNSLQGLSSPLIKESRGRGLFIGVELAEGISAHEVCRRLLSEGIFTVDAHDKVVRFTPPLVVSYGEISKTVEKFKKVLGSF